MKLIEILKKAFLDGYATSDINVQTILICTICTMLISAYIFLVYKHLNKNAFYNRGFNLSLMGISIIISAVILTIQSNIVVSLGMVGALSIVRFRTAIKDPMDLVFLFWAISVGIICGAGFALIAVVASLGMTCVILLFNMLPVAGGNLVLVVNANSNQCENQIMDVVNASCKYAKIKARNLSKTSLNLAIEVKVEDQGMLVRKIMEIDNVANASLVAHDGEITV